MTHRSVVQILEQFGNRRVEGGQREEAAVPKTGQNPSLDDQHRAFDPALVARLTAAGRQDRGVVMLRHGSERRRQCRLEPKGLGHSRFEVVAHDSPGNLTIVGQSAHLAVDPVRQALAEAGMGEGQVGGAQHRDKDLAEWTTPVAGSITGTVGPA